MKQGFVKFFAVLALMIVSVFAITACGEEDVQPPVTYAVTYVKGADEATGEAPASAQKEEGAKFNLPANPFTYTGYEFAGWSDGAQTYAANAEYTMPAKAVTFTAQWNSTQPSVTYAVTYAKGADEATGEAPASVQKAQGEKFNLPANPFTYAGHEFTGWSDGAQTYVANAEYTMPAKAVAFTAQWAALHTVTVDPNNGEEPAEYTVRNGEKFTAVLETPVHPDGKTFRYWAANGSEYNFDKAVTGDIELTAEYAWKITFNAGEGASGTVEPQWVKLWAMGITLPEGTGLSCPEKAFGGWNDGNQTYAAGDRYTGSGNVTFTAVWNDIDVTTKYELSYYSGAYNGVTGTTPPSVQKSAGETVILPENPFTKNGSVFTGWCPQVYKNINSNPYDEPVYGWEDADSSVRLQPGETYTMPAKNIRLSAKWAAENYTVTVRFQANGGTGTMSNGTFTFGNRFVLPQSTFTPPANKIFSGWAYSATGTVITKEGISKSDYQSYVSSSNPTLNLYAIWEDAPVLTDISEVIGVWSNGSDTVTISSAGADPSLYVVGTAIWNGKVYTPVMQLNDGGFIAYDCANTTYVFSKNGSNLTVSVNEGAAKTYSKSGEASNAPASEFAGKWVKSGTTQNWVITETNAYFGSNLTSANSLFIAGNYVVIKVYVSFSGLDTVYVLAKNGNSLVGWYDSGDPEKSEAQRITQTTFDIGNYLLLSIEGEPNQIVNSGSAPNSAKLVEPAAPSGQEFDKWVYVSGETEFDPTAAMTADANIKAAFKDKAGAENTVDFAGSYTASGLLGTSVTFTKFSVDFDGMQVTYTLANGTAKTVALTDESSSPYKPSDLGSDAFYFSVVMETKSYYLLIAQNKSSLLLCNQDDEVLQGGNFSVQTSSGDWVSLTVAEGSEFYNLAAAGTKYYFAESFENTGTTFIGIQFYKSSLGVGVKTIYLSNGAEKVLTSTISYSANDGNQLVFSSSAYIIKIGKKSDGKYYVTSFSYKNNVDTTERVLLTEKP